MKGTAKREGNLGKESEGKGNGKGCAPFSNSCIGLPMLRIHFILYFVYLLFILNKISVL